MSGTYYNSLEMKRAYTDTTWTDTYGNVWGYHASEEPIADLPSVPEMPEETTFPTEEVFDEEGNLWRFACIADGECVIESMAPVCATITVPSLLNGRRVVALAPQCCMSQTVVEEVFFSPFVRVIGRKAFAYAKNLKRIHLAEGLQIIEGFAFMNTDIDSFHAPSTLHTIEEKAFYRCFNLSSLTLNNELQIVGKEAFALTGIGTIDIPASVHDLGTRILEAHPEQSAAFVQVSPDNPYFLSDEAGTGLYERTPEGLILYDYRGQVPVYEVLPGTVEIAPYTFANNAALEKVILPEGLLKIGEAAFRACKNLKLVELPDSLETIGPWAFFESDLRELRLPVNLRWLDDASLVVRCASGAPNSHAPFMLEIDPRNERFYLSTGVLCERLDEGYDRAINYTGSEHVVHIPETVRELGRNLFYRVDSIDELYLHDSIPFYDALTFSTAKSIGHVHFDLATPYEGRNEVDLYFDQNDRARLYFQNFTSVLQSDPFNMRALQRMSDQGIHAMPDPYIRGRLALQRLSDPYLLDAGCAKVLESTISTNWRNICRCFAERYYTKGIIQMVDLGFIDEESFDEAIEIVREAGNVGAAGQLLELKHKRFGGSVFSEYDL